MSEGSVTRAYVITTGTLFGLLTIVHIWRVVVERDLATDPAYLGITAIAAAMAVWSWRVVSRLSSQSGVGQS